MKVRRAWSSLSRDGKALVVVTVLLVLTMLTIYAGLLAAAGAWETVLGNPG